MIDLLTRPPDDWHVLQPQGSPASIQFYYGVRVGETHQLSMGAHFGVVYSPNYKVHPQSSLRPWCYVVFEVTLFQYRRDRGMERSYRQVQRRQLTRFEVPHFEALWLDMTMMGEGRKTG